MIIIDPRTAFATPERFPGVQRPFCQTQNLRSRRKRFAPLKKGLRPPRVRSRLMDDCAPHATEPLASALRRIERACDLIVIFGRCAITDLCDVVPSAIEKADSRIEHYGMPLNPAICLCLVSFRVRVR
jgi:hypothetical protein